MAENTDNRVLCKYAEKCYQKNPEHLKKYRHPEKRKSDEIESTEPKEAKKLKISHEDIDDPKEKLDESVSTVKNVASHEDFIKEKFLITLPSDFYELWKFCESINKNEPSLTFKEYDLELVGPYDVLANKFSNVEKTESEYFRHWRYYYDPPEFQTVIKGNDKTGYHIGYFRDSPDEAPQILVSGHLKDGELTVLGSNIFDAVNAYLEDYKKNKCTPFNKGKVIALQKKLQDWTKENNIKLDTKTEALRARNLKVIAKTFNKLGIVVPYNKKTQMGYRPLLETTANLKKILNNITSCKEEETELQNSLLTKLQPVLTAASIAADECDFGTSLELGLNLFANGDAVFHKMILSLLGTAYNLLNRDEFFTILKSHLENRQKHSKLSVL